MSAFFIVGATATGKTALALRLAEEFDAEIVSADAYQLYAGLDVLSAKPEPEELARVRHHLIGSVPLGESMHAVRYRELALAALEDIRSRGKRAIVCGGSGLYVKALTHGFDEGPPPDPERRAFWASQPLETLVARLQQMDPQRAREIDLQNPRRVIRALEDRVDGRSRPAGWTTYAPLHPTVGLFLQRERTELHQRIARRTRRMFERGLLDEVRAARVVGVGSTAEQMIGWAECCACLDSRLTQSQAEERITIATRQYAKRQHTWFKREPIFEPLLVTGESGLRAARDAASSLMRRILPLVLGSVTSVALLHGQGTKPAAPIPAAQTPSASAPAASAPAVAQPGPDAAKSGKLVFEKDMLEQKADTGATTIAYKFPFVIKGTEKVTLFSTETDCGCTAAALEKQIYEPGEKGEITVNFRIGDLTGTQLKKVRLRASDQSEPHVLTLKTEIPIFAKVVPQFVVWNHREEKTPKIITFELGPENKPIDGLTITSNVPGITSTVNELVKGRKYEVLLTPTQTETFFLATIDISAKVAGGQAARTMKAYATVKPPPVDPPTAQAAVQPGK